MSLRTRTPTPSRAWIRLLVGGGISAAALLITGGAAAAASDDAARQARTELKIIVDERGAPAGGAGALPAAGVHDRGDCPYRGGSPSTAGDAR
jgi:hypothetical protein